MKSRRFPLLLSGIIFGFSLFLPPFALKGNSAFNIGFVLLVFGWGYEHVAWYANLLYAASFITYGTVRKTWFPAIVSGLALALGWTAMSIKEIPHDEGTMKPVVVTHMNWGFYFWLLSMLIILCAAAIDTLSRETPASDTV